VENVGGKMNLKKYPIIKEYEVYLGFCDEIVEEAKKLENEIKK
jgi:hypothetical protein